MSDMPNDTEKIGHLISKDGLKALCFDCASKVPAEELITLYYANVYPYSQHCAECGHEIVAGQFPNDLYDK